ncbi:hypothetical protein AB1283_01010 [Bacillus sp. S13(2024)]|uniref:hypothetical protein n=1 Tax=Bacillus sp. S13(2024) TaxID=3162885 RepID=UPI003D250537
MIILNRITEYLKAIQIGFAYYGLNGFYEMHEDACKNKNNTWVYALESLNDLDNEEFKSLCDIYLKSIK